MKKIFYLYFLALPLLFAACSDDDKTPDSLKGTSWEWTYSSAEEGQSVDVLTFTSETSITSIYRLTYGDYAYADTSQGTYSYSKPNLSIKFDEETTIGKVDGNKMTIEFIDDGKKETMVYYKK